MTQIRLELFMEEYFFILNSLHKRRMSKVELFDVLKVHEAFILQRSKMVHGQ